MPVEHLNHAAENDDETPPNPFEAWMLDVDRYVWQIAGCSVHDLPDCNFHPLFTDGLTAAEMAMEALELAGFQFPDEGAD